MAQLSPGETFQTNQFVTPNDFHDLVDDSSLVNVKTTDLAAARLLYITTPGAPSTGDVRVGSDGRLEFFFGGVWNTQPPEELDLTLTNRSGSDLIIGDVVTFDHSNSASFTIASVTPAPDVAGVLMANIANLASGLVRVRGQCLVRVAAAAGLAAGTLLRGPSGALASPALRVAAVGATDPRSDLFGILLESAGPATTDTAQAYIWK